MPLLGRYAKAIRSLMGLDASRVEVLPELIPTIQMQAADASMAFARGESLYGVSAYQGAVAGQYSLVAFRNPADSNKLGVFDLMEAWSTANPGRFRVRMERGGTAAATPVAVAARDPRIWSNVPPYPIPNSIEISQGSVAAVPGHLLHTFQTSAANLKDLWLGPVVLVPGSTLYFVTDAVNSTIWLNINWWERVVLGEEYA